MKFKKLACILLAAVLALCAVSALADTEEEYEARIAELEARIAELEHQLVAKDYVAEFDGGFVTVEEAQAQLDYLSYMYSYYGYSIDGYEDIFRQNVVDSLVDTAIVKRMGQELGFYDLDEADQAELMEIAQEDLDSYISTYRYNFESEDATEEEIIASTTAYLVESGITLDTLYEQQLEYRVSDQVYAYVCDPITITEDDVRAKYDELVGADQVAYGVGGGAFESALTMGTDIYWYPVGYRNVRQVLVAFDEDQNARYSEITGRISSLENELVEAQNPSEEPASEDEEEAEDEAPRAEAEIRADLDAANAELEALYAELQPTVDEVYEKFEGGTPIDELIATYGGDPGSINSDGTTNTYAVSNKSTSYDTPFKEAAMSIENIGELAQPARGYYGVYIVYYDSDMTSGAVDYDSVSATLYDLALEEARSDAYDAQLKAWKEELHLVYYMENFR